MTINRETIKRVLVITSVIIVAIVIIAYSYHASKGIIVGPTIVITSPSVDETSFSSSTVEIKGIATRTQSISLNGRAILIDESGNFLETVILSPGYNVETLQGIDKFSHATTASLQLIYKPN